MAESPDLHTRTIAALRALAAGDAMGRATEHYQPAEIDDVYEGTVEEFVEPVRLLDDEDWAEGETGPLTELVCAMAGAQPEDIRWHPDATTVDRLPLAVAAGIIAACQDASGLQAANPVELTLGGAMHAALTGRAAHEVVAVAEQAARSADDPGLADGIREALTIAQSTGGRRPGAALRERYAPDGDVGQLVPFIIGIVYATQSARRAILEAVNQGGHAPETAGIAGALCAAISPASLPETWGTTVEMLNGLDLAAVADVYAARSRFGAKHG